MTNILLKNICKAFGDKQVLKDFSLEIKQGETVCIMGASGCGKTTVANLILGLEKADCGTIKVPSNLSAVFQEDRLCEEFSALSNVYMCADKACSKSKCSKILDSLGLGGEQNNKVSSLSGGMKRRVAIARAVAVKADAYIFDEPFKGLDENTKDEVIKHLIHQLEGKTVLIVTHEESDALRLGARIVIMPSAN